MGYIKVKITDSTVDVIEYERDPYIPDKPVSDELMWFLTGEMPKEKPAWLKEKNLGKSRKANAHKTKQAFIDLTNANASHWKSFITLTFGDNDFDVTDLAACNKAFDKFSQRLKYKHPDVRWLLTYEYQTSGRVHYHMLTNIRLDWNDDDERKELERTFAEHVWKYGFVNFRRLTDQEGNSIQNVGLYMAKYMTKAMADNPDTNKKAYRGSQNLDRPLVLTGEQARVVADSLALHTPDYSRTFPTEYLGEGVHKYYNKETLYGQGQQHASNLIEEMVEHATEESTIDDTVNRRGKEVVRRYGERAGDNYNGVHRNGAHRGQGRHRTGEKGFSCVRRWSTRRGHAEGHG